MFRIDMIDVDERAHARSQSHSHILSVEGRGGGWLHKSGRVGARDEHGAAEVCRSNTVRGAFTGIIDNQQSASSIPTTAGACASGQVMAVSFCPRGLVEESV